MTAVTIEARRALVADDTGRLHVRHARLTVQGAWITDVQLDPAGPPPPDADDLGDALLTPALTNAHTHLALTGLRGMDVEHAAEGNMVEELFFRVERRMSRDDIRAFAAVGAQEALLGGTATVWDHYYQADAVREALDDVGLSGVVAPALQDLAGPGAHAWEAALRTTHDLAADASARERGHAVALGPHATDTVSDALWARIAETAESLDLPVHVHVAQSLEEVERAAAHAGTTPLGRLARTGALDAGPHWLLVHGLYLTDDDLRRLDADRHSLVACPHAQAQFGFPAPVAAWEAAGARWVVGTDCAAANDAWDLLPELRALEVLRTADITSDAAYTSWRATGDVDAARAVERERQRRHLQRADLGDPSRLLARVWSLPGSVHPDVPSGRLAPGHLAHLALWDLAHPAMWPGTDPARALAAGSVTGALQQVMVAGRWRGERGRFHASLVDDPDWRAQRAEAHARRASLLAG